jgi:hypothetical protein
MARLSASSFASEATGTVASSVVLEIVQRDLHFLGESEERRAQKPNGDDEEESSAVFMPEPEEGARECQREKQCGANPTAKRQACGIAQEPFPALQARDIRFELDSRGIIFGDFVQAAEPVENAGRPRDQDRDEAGNRAKKKGRRRCVQDDL